MKTLKERFDEKWIEDKKTGCWEWQAWKDKKGYGVIGIKIKGKTHPRFAHRIGYEIYKGVDPGKLCVCHKCDNPGCVNPDCMFLGTHKENMKDMARKGRSQLGKPKPYQYGELHPKSIITDEEAKLIIRLCNRYPNRKLKQAQGWVQFVSRWLGHPYERVRNVLKPNQWKHVKV